MNCCNNKIVHLQVAQKSLKCSTLQYLHSKSNSFQLHKEHELKITIIMTLRCTDSLTRMNAIRQPVDEVQEECRLTKQK